MSSTKGLCDDGTAAGTGATATTAYSKAEHTIGKKLRKVRRAYVTRRKLGNASFRSYMTTRMTQSLRGLFVSYAKEDTPAAERQCAARRGRRGMLR